ncbi:NeuD/PglB/VioB family sugar acetyltransferase [Plantibacter flavus]|uniref:NeuD/PglB/VioB family sugar acetyltransferase n=1 Tax=Plantibacter flavus TaxID=150123 RepID=UPI003F167E71
MTGTVADQRVGLLGNGGQAREAVEILGRSRLAFIAVSAAYRDLEDPLQIDLDAVPQSLVSTPVVAAVGAPGLRRALVQGWPGSQFATLTSSSATTSSSSSIGRGCIIAAGAVVSTDVSIGDHSLINIAASVSHDTALGDYVTISPGCRIAGGVTIGDGVFLGIGAIVSNGVRIADGCVIGAGAVVVDDLETPGVYIGVPARLHSPIGGWLEAI